MFSKKKTENHFTLVTAEVDPVRKTVGVVRKTLNVRIYLVKHKVRHRRTRFSLQRLQGSNRTGKVGQTKNS